DELRTRRRNQFFIGLGAAVGAAGLVILASNFVMNGVISSQKARNKLLEDEIALLDERIAEILDLEAKKERLLARMEIIEQLQRSRPEIVHVFEELARTLPDGVRLTAVKQAGKRVEIRGDAESNTRVSAFMRNLDKSQWFTQPDLEIVEVREAGSRNKKGLPQETGEFAGRSSQFVVYANQVSVTDDEEVEK
ncbi:MAG: PilN domain-containing protein, partial [Gammaproteobacteria bacterium]|nr:PilN domain-containing protein [Gammaproteobacteria bacterium]